MNVDNETIANIFEESADLLEFGEGNEFRIRAYRNAARAIRGLPFPASQIVEADSRHVVGIGVSLTQKIKEIIGTGTLKSLEILRKKIPSGLRLFLNLPGIGPKHAKLFYDELKISTIEELKAAAEKGLLAKLPHFGEKSQAKVLASIAEYAATSKRVPLINAESIVSNLLSFLKDCKNIRKMIIAGSYRRRKETIGDLDVLLTCEDSKSAIKEFLTFPQIVDVIVQGPKKLSVNTQSHMQIDVRLVQESSYGAALQYFTGSKEFNIKMRNLALSQGLKLNEYGLYKENTRVAGKTEEEIFKYLGLAFIPPEMREDHGEIECAQKNQLPMLIKLEDIKGSLHNHTNETDGRASLSDMVFAAKKAGLSYIAITDHSKNLRIAKGLDEKRLLKQIDRIRNLAQGISDFDILTGIEVDILENGKLDLSDEVLKELDVVVCSIHSNFNLSEEKQTERVIRAMDNSYFNIFGHPTGRLLLKRKSYAIDIERVMDAAVERGCFLELNAQPERLDLDDNLCRLAKNKGLKLSLAADAHDIHEFKFLQYGIDQARRGWLEAGDVINTLNASELKKILRRL